MDCPSRSAGVCTVAETTVPVQSEHAEVFIRRRLLGPSRYMLVVLLRRVGYRINTVRYPMVVVATASLASGRLSALVAGEYDARRRRQDQQDQQDQQDRVTVWQWGAFSPIK